MQDEEETDRRNLMKHNFCVFIMSYKRADDMWTINTLRRSGYSGPIYIIIGDDEPDKEAYYENFGKDNVIEFSKEEALKRFDLCTNEDIKNTITYARNMLYDIAKDLGYDYFAQFEDDYQHFDYRYTYNGKLMYLYSEELDDVFDAMIDFLDDTHADIVAFAQGGDFIGGMNNSFLKTRIKRKVMNTLFCRTDNPVTFIGAMNDDVNVYVTYGKRGRLFLSVADMMVFQRPTQRGKGGNADMYNALGTYSKSFYSVMINPSCVKVSDIDPTFKRIHHAVMWDKAVPKIISQNYQKF